MTAALNQNWAVLATCAVPHVPTGSSVGGFAPPPPPGVGTSGLLSGFVLHSALLWSHCDFTAEEEAGCFGPRYHFGWMDLVRNAPSLQPQGKQPGVSKEHTFSAESPWLTDAPLILL